MPAATVLKDAYKIGHDSSFLYHDKNSKKHMDFHSVKELPEAYAWSPSSSSSTCPDSVPVIDLEDPRAQELIGSACKTWGAFQVINHGVADELLRQVLSQGRRLFSLPIHQKLKASREPDGVSGYGPARISSFFPKLLWSEGFTIYGSPLEHARQLWPQNYGNFCDTIEQYEDAMKQLAGRLMWLVLGTLGITKEDVDWAGPSGNFSDSCAALQLNSYPTCPDPVRAMGLAAHTDSTLLTIVHQTQVAGLQVHREGHPDWITVPPIPSALVVNIGDLLHIMSNGLYPSVVHRAMVSQTHHRFSVAYLYGPPTDTLVAPLPRLVTKERPPLYKPISWAEYLATKAKHFNKALEMVRLCASPLVDRQIGCRNMLEVGS